MCQSVKFLVLESIISAYKIIPDQKGSLNKILKRNKKIKFDDVGKENGVLIAKST